MRRWTRRVLLCGCVLALAGMVAVPASASPRGYDLNVFLNDRLPEWWLHPNAPTMRSPLSAPLAAPLRPPAPLRPLRSAPAPSGDWSPPEPFLSGAPPTGRYMDEVPTVRGGRAPRSRAPSDWYPQ